LLVQFFVLLLLTGAQAVLLFTVHPVLLELI
jgi:hypothetical protein